MQTALPANSANMHVHPAADTGLIRIQEPAVHESPHAFAFLMTTCAILAGVLLFVIVGLTNANPELRANETVYQIRGSEIELPNHDASSRRAVTPLPVSE